MKSIFKTAILATAIATACGSAYAGTVTVDGGKKTYSAEGVARQATVATVPVSDIQYVTEAAYAVGDKVTYSFSAGALDNAASFPAQINVAADETVGDEKAGMALGRLNFTDDSVTYRVTSITQPGVETSKTTYGQTVTLSGVQLDGNVVAEGDVSVFVNGTTSSGSDVIDTANMTAVLTDVTTQFGSLESLGTNVFDGVIDVTGDRKNFIDDNVSVDEDEITFEISEVANSSSFESHIESADINTTITITGEDLSGLDETDFGFTSAQADIVNNSLVISYDSEVTTDTIVFTAPGDVQLKPQSFDISAEYSFSNLDTPATETEINAGSKSAGEWTLNGSMVNIPYMPFGSNISQILYVTNTGSIPADITVEAYDMNGTAYPSCGVGTATANGVTKITSQVKQCFIDNGYIDGTSNKFSITVTVNAPDSQITVYSAYNVSGNDRGNVLNSQYKGK